MSGIAGIFNRDGRPVERELFTRTLESISHRGPDGSDQWVNGNIALGHQMMWTTPEAHHETQPLLDETGQFCLVMDGRVDNRAEVKKALADAGFAVRKDTDADIMLRAYECWGEAFPFRIVGDFAVAIWDARKRQLFCTRDVFGVKPFYYGLHQQSFVFSSEVRSFFADPSFPCEPNEGVVGEFLANNITSKEETLYQQIFRIPPAHFLIVDNHGIKKQRYWDFDPKKEVRYRNDAEYAEHFLELFTEVLTQHMRSDRPVGADLSGGLDSTSIVCLAHSLFKKGVLPKNGFETFSLMFLDHKEADESKYINDAIQMWDVKANLLAPSNDHSVYAKAVEHSCYFPSPPNGRMMDSMKASAQEKGFRAMLTGIGGDEFFNGNSLHCADLLKRGKIFAAINEAEANRHSSSLPLSFMQNGMFPLLKPIIPEAALQFIRLIRHGKLKSLPFAPITPEFVERSKLRERLINTSRAMPFRNHSQNATYQMMQEGWFSFRFEMEECDSSLFNLEYRFPLHDRRIAEFCLALPGEQRKRGAKTKFILRQAMQTILPESIRQRTDKGDFTFVFPQAFESLNGLCFLDTSNLADNGWVNGSQLQTMYREMMERYYTGKDYPIWQLWMIFGLELWTRSMFSKQSVVATSAALQFHTAGL